MKPELERQYFSQKPLERFKRRNIGKDFLAGSCKRSLYGIA